MSGKDMPYITKMKQGPVVVVSAQIDMATASAVSAVGAAMRHVFGTMHMRASSTALS